MRNSARRKALDQLDVTPPDATMPPARQSMEDYGAMPDSQVLDDGDIAAWFGYKRATIRTWRSLGLGPQFFDVHGRPRTTVGLARAWLASRPRIVK